MTMRTSKVHFGGLSLTLKKQSSGKKEFGVFMYPTAIFLNGLLPKDKKWRVRVVVDYAETQVHTL